MGGLFSQKESINTNDPNSYVNVYNSWMAQNHPYNSGVQPQGVNSWDTGFFGSNVFKNTLDGFGLAFNAWNGIQNYRLGKQYLNQAKDNLAFQKAQFNETYNNALKQYNAGLADRIRARAAFETGNSHSYDDEITANSMGRNPNASDLGYKRSSNAV